MKVADYVRQQNVSKEMEKHVNDLMGIPDKYITAFNKSADDYKKRTVCYAAITNYKTDPKLATMLLEAAESIHTPEKIKAPLSFQKISEKVEGALMKLDVQKGAIETVASFEEAKKAVVNFIEYKLTDQQKSMLKRKGIIVEELITPPANRISMQAAESFFTESAVPANVLSEYQKNKLVCAYVSSTLYNELIKLTAAEKDSAPAAMDSALVSNTARLFDGTNIAFFNKDSINKENQKHGKYSGIIYGSVPEYEVYVMSHKIAECMQWIGCNGNPLLQVAAESRTHAKYLNETFTEYVTQNLLRSDRKPIAIPSEPAYMLGERVAETLSIIWGDNKLEDGKPLFIKGYFSRDYEKLKEKIDPISNKFFSGDSIVDSTYKLDKIMEQTSYDALKHLGELVGSSKGAYTLPAPGKFKVDGWQ